MELNYTRGNVFIVHLLALVICVFTASALVAVMAACEPSHWFHPLQPQGLYPQHQQKTLTVHPETFFFFFLRLHNGTELWSFLCQLFPPCSSSRGIFGAHCHHRHLTWCGNYALPFHSPLGRCLAAEQQPFAVLIFFNKCFHLKLNWEPP